MGRQRIARHLRRKVSGCFSAALVAVFFCSGPASAGAPMVVASAGTAAASIAACAKSLRSVHVRGSAACVPTLAQGPIRLSPSLRESVLALGTNVLALGNPTPTFTQVIAGSTAALGAFELLRCVDNADSTCTLTVSGTVTANPPSSASATLTNVTSSASSTTCLAANTARKGVILYNDSTAILYLGLTASAVSTTSYTTQVASQGYFQMPNPVNYTGQITCIWASANGAARVTELI